MIARVFPRRNAATPDDPLAFVGYPKEGLPEIDRVMVSVTFTWDMARAERLQKAWSAVAPAEIGGSALDMRGEAFTPGLFLKQGYVITSRGCPNRCKHCSVWHREGKVLRELPITEGWNVLDDNLLACSETHIRAVFAMLARQPERAQFTGGLEAARLELWQVDLLALLNPDQIFFAYDEPADYEPLVRAGQMLKEAGFTWTQRALRCYVLCGFDGDTMDAASRRMQQTVDAGFWPAAMLFRGMRGEFAGRHWERFQRAWQRPALLHVRLRDEKAPTLFSVSGKAGA
jgi:hypothetical protein